MSTIRNGVNLTNIENLLGAIQENPGLAEVQFKATSTWLGGTQAKVQINSLMAGGQDIAREGRSFSLVVDEPPELGGLDEAPNPVEHLAAALCGCLTAGIATNAALFETDLDRIEVDVEVDFNIHGVLGLDDSYPNGPLGLHYRVRLGGPGAPEAMRKSKETLDRKSPVKNTIELPLKVTTEFELLDD